MEEIKTLIGEAIGTASMLWEHNDRGGVFQSDEGVKLVDRTVESIDQYIKKNYTPNKGG